MKLKKKFIYIGLSLAIGLQSCEKWFDVTANDQVRAEDQFASADGFRDALIGVYLNMGNQSLYGKDMTFNMVDLLSQQYAALPPTLARYSDIQQFNYTTVRSEAQIESVWNQLYYTVANVNAALTQLENSDISWHEGEQEILRGELLGLRAFLHFDIMRLFGHSGFADRPELANKLAIPYSTTYSKDYAPQLGYTETFALMEKDLAEAASLLKYDPIHAQTSSTAAILAQINRDGFYDNRQNRMNYYAVKALQARVWAWQGGTKMANAAEAAQEVIEASPATLLGPNQSLLNNKTIANEHIFSLKVSGLEDISNPLLDIANNTNYNALKIANATVENIYEVAIPTIGQADVRFNTLFTTEGTSKASIKLRQTNVNDIDYNTMPLIKLPEMYYIAAEYWQATDLQRAISLIEEVRQSRRIVQPLDNQLTPEEIQRELLKEYLKEYISEGQLFFYYKRLGLTQIPNYSTAIEADDNIYMLPFPASEIEAGNRVQ